MNTQSELLVREVAQGHPSTQLWCPLQCGWQVAPRVFLHTGQILPTHTLTTGTQLPRSLFHTHCTQIYAWIWMHMHAQEDVQGCSHLYLPLSLICSPSNHQLNLLNLTLCFLHPSLLPPPLHPSHAVFFARSLLRRGRQLTESEEEKTSFPPRETPLKTHVQPRTHVDIPAAYLNDYYFFQGPNLLLEL